MLNATGGWTAIDEELDPDSTNPVQNKTLFNCLSYYQLIYDTTYKKYKLNSNIIPKYSQLIKVHMMEDIIVKNNDNKFEIVDKDGYSRKVISGHKATETSTYYEDAIIGERSETARIYLAPFNIRKADGSYEAIYFTKGTCIEMYKSAEYWMVIGDLIVGRVKQQINYSTHTDWNTFAEAVVYASGLKIQWGNFNPHSSSVQNYFPVSFYEAPSMSFAFNANSDHTVYYQDTPCAISSEEWKNV